MCDRNVKVAVSQSSDQNAQFLGEKMEAQRKDVPAQRSAGMGELELELGVHLSGLALLDVFTNKRATEHLQVQGTESGQKDK